MSKDIFPEDQFEKADHLKRQHHPVQSMDIIKVIHFGDDKLEGPGKAGIDYPTTTPGPRVTVNDEPGILAKDPKAPTKGYFNESPLPKPRHQIGGYYEGEMDAFAVERISPNVDLVYLDSEQRLGRRYEHEYMFDKQQSDEVTRDILSLVTEHRPRALVGVVVPEATGYKPLSDVDAQVAVDMLSPEGTSTTTFNGRLQAFSKGISLSLTDSFGLFDANPLRPKVEVRPGTETFIFEVDAKYTLGTGMSDSLASVLLYLSQRPAGPESDRS